MGRKTTEVKQHFHYIISSILFTVDVNGDHLAELVFARFLRCKVTLFFCSFHTVLWKKVMCSLHVAGRYSLPLEGPAAYVNYLEFYTGDLSVLPILLFNQPFI